MYDKFYFKKTCFIPDNKSFLLICITIKNAFHVTNSRTHQIKYYRYVMRGTTVFVSFIQLSIADKDRDLQLYV